MTTDFMISGKKKDIVGIINTAARFTAQDSGSAAYLKCIHIAATEEVITMTGASEFNGIKVTEKVGKISVDHPGEVLVQSHWLTTSLQVVQEDHELSIAYDNETRKLIVKSWGKDKDREQLLELDLPKIDIKAMVPSVGDPDFENGVVLDPQKFVSTYSSASVARDTQGTRPIVAGVLAVPDTESLKFRMMSMDAKFKTAMDAFSMENVIGEGCGAFLLHDQPTRFVVEYLLQGDLVHMHRDDHDQLHFIVLDSQQDQRYHIRAATVNQPVDKFPEAKMHHQLGILIPGALATVSVDKAEFLRILRSAATVGSLDANNIGGQSKNIMVTLRKGEIEASVLTSAVYDEAITADFNGVDPDIGEDYEIKYILKYGLHGHILESYDNDRDPSNLDFMVLENPKFPGKPFAMLLFKDNPLLLSNDDSGEQHKEVELTDYLSLFGVQAVEG